MRAGLVGGAVLTAIILAGCGKPDASGIYVVRSDRHVTMVQLVETKDGALTGRLEDVSIDGAGVVHDQSVNLDGAASGHDLMFKPNSVWLGGVTATGTFDHSGLTMTGSNISLKALHSSLDQFQTAVAHLQTVAANQRQSIANAKAAEAAQEASAAAERDQADKTAKLEAAATQLRNDAATLNAAVDQSPNFGQRADANTARMSRMLQVAPTLGNMDRNRLIVEANQVIVRTNEIEVGRQQYANGLNQILNRSIPLANDVQRFCTSPQAAQFAQPCAGATAGVEEFKRAVAHGLASFNPYKQAVQNALSRQNAMLGQMGG